MEPTSTIDTQANPSNEPTETTITLDYLSTNLRVFRSCPLFKEPENYLSWLVKIEKQKIHVWKEMEIFDIVPLSKVGPSYCQTMLITSLYFWDNTHNNFHFPCGMLTLTLFDIAAITGLRPTGENFNPNFMTEDSIGSDSNIATFTNYILYHHNQDNDEVSNEEHITFLALWLSRCVFCSKYLQVAKKYLTMANQLHARHKLCLSQMIPGCLYESLGEGVKILKQFRP